MLLRRQLRLFVIFTIVIFLLAIAILLNPSPRIISSLSTYICPAARYFYRVDRPVIALTIDDSPDNNGLVPNTTSAILDTLAQYQIKATFFIITSKAKNNPQLINQIVKQGHELGNHLTVDESSIKLGNQFEAEFVKADRFLAKFAAINWFRPGHGWCNSSMTQIVHKYNYEIALGSVWSYDTAITSDRFSSWYIQRNIRPGSIIILHDSDDKSDIRGINTVKTLNKIIPQLQQRGYHFVTLSELEKMII
ncbi:polysaccharide deacetylase family protein [Pleurocapsa sp. PCC 7319]|uniref:polysaccharide deacetylase family protein n=1 Tax=Pleurocapsa sp. PCC 7319 TaxID=118161 RepID=UPI000346A032|nr:polysaccharide deacetylase family protein [Pleurocapsa sp. PCC 7319]